MTTLRPFHHLFLNIAGVILLGSALIAPAPLWGQSVQRIIATVNDEPITAYDLSQRARFTAATSNRKVSRKLSGIVLQQLISEKLQLQEAKRTGITVADSEIKAALANISKRNKISLKRLTAFLKSRGVKLKTLEQKIRTELAWNSVVRRKFRHLVSIGDSDIKLHMSKTGKKTKDGAKKGPVTVFELQKLLLQFAQGRTELEVKHRMDDAEKLRASFKTCRRWRAKAKRYRNIKSKYIEQIKLDAVEEPLRSTLAKTEAGKVTSPELKPDGIEIIAVCNRKEQSAKTGKRATVKSQLENQQLGQFSQRHLRDLRRDAVIEYPNKTGKNPYALKPSTR